MREVEIAGRKYRVKELTYGEVLELLEASTRTVITPTGDVRQVTDLKGSGITLIRLCIEVEDSGRYRPLTDDEIKRLPASHGMKLADECLAVNSFLRQA